MPAATVDPLTLPRLPEPLPGDRERAVKLVSTAPAGFEGEGFPVKRAFAGVPQEALDPFIHMDEMGSIDYGPGEPRGTSWHPHRGFETVTYILDGSMQHQDSHGGGGLISNGDTQWMTAGAGILHIETPPEHLVVSGGLFHGLQLWVNLPAAQKWAPPRYQSLQGGQATLVASDDGGALVRIVAGDVGDHSGPGSTHTPMAFVHATVAPGARLYLPWRPDFNALVYVMGGSGRVGPGEGRAVHGVRATQAGHGVRATQAGHGVRATQAVRAGQLAVFGAGDHLSITADPTQDSSSATLEVIVLGGRPIGEPVAWYGPFVMNTKAELLQAMEDYRAGRLGVVPPGALMPHHPM